ncbi:MAG: 7-cyano-7-deazaguanine synthase [Phycisphaeraceae bacterium]|nr:7-cyano-7-deazaguanine synthase [Phycisphaeraceae bacterium]
MQVSGETVLVIHDGSPEALVASLICPDPSCVVAWIPPYLPTARKSRMQTVKRQVDLLGLDSLITPGASDIGASDRHAGPYVRTWTLLQAVTTAASRGCGRVVWPVRCGDDFNQGVEAADRTLLLSRLISIDTEAGATPVRIDTPLLDLTIDQLLELARDLDAPLEASWWCQREGSTPCGGCSACTTWRTAVARSRMVLDHALIPDTD